MLESASLPETVRREYEEAQKKRFQISFYVADEKSKSKDEGHAAGRVEGQIEVLKGLIEDGTTTLDDILKSSRYSEEVKQKLRELLRSKM
jgi:flagellar biosynthesis/type III secretory pathway protein FliH